MKCYFCKFCKYKDGYNIDLDKKTKNNFVKIKNKKKSFNENNVTQEENINILFNMKNNDFNIQIIQ